MWDVSIEHKKEAVGPGFHEANAKTTHASVLLPHLSFLDDKLKTEMVRTLLKETTLHERETAPK